jgi:hypothetical protein
MPLGMKSGSMTEAMNRMLIRGTPRIISMKMMAITRMAGSFEERARASTTPKGNPKASPTAESRNESGRPLHCVVGT